MEGKRRKLGSDLISEEAIVLEELAKIDGEDENHQPALTFNGNTVFFFEEIRFLHA